MKNTIQQLLLLLLSSAPAVASLGLYHAVFALLAISDPASGRKHTDIQMALMAQRQGEHDAMQELEDGSVMNDVAAAEEEYERPAQVIYQPRRLHTACC